MSHSHVSSTESSILLTIALPTNPMLACRTASLPGFRWSPSAHPLHRAQSYETAVYAEHPSEIYSKVRKFHQGVASLSTVSWKSPWKIGEKAEKNER